MEDFCTSVHALSEDCAMWVQPYSSSCSYIPESMRWLRLNGKTDEIMKILKRIAKFNGKEIPDIQLGELKQESSAGLGHYLNLFRPRKIAFRSLIQGYSW